MAPAPRLHPAGDRRRFIPVLFYSPFFTPPSRRSSSSLDLAIQFLLLSATPKPHVAWLRPSAVRLGTRLSRLVARARTWARPTCHVARGARATWGLGPNL